MSASWPTWARRSLKVLLVAGLKMPMRLWSEMPDWRATMALTSSIVASAGTSMVAGSFLIGCFGAGQRKNTSAFSHTPTGSREESIHEIKKTD